MAIFGKLALILVAMQVAMWTVDSALDNCPREQMNVLFHTRYVKEWCDTDNNPIITRCVARAKTASLVACVRASDVNTIYFERDEDVAVTEGDCENLKNNITGNKARLNGHYTSCIDGNSPVPDSGTPAANLLLKFAYFCNNVTTHEPRKMYAYHQALNSTWTCRETNDKPLHSCVNMAKDKCMKAEIAKQQGLAVDINLCNNLAADPARQALYEENVCKPWIIPPPPTTAAASTTAEPTSTAVPTIAVTVPQPGPGPSSTGPAECVTEDNADQEKEICTWEDTWTLADEQASQDAFDAAGLEPPTRESHCDDVGCYD